MSRQAIQVVDLGFGDSGKGTLVDYLVREHAATLVVRFNGGPQAGHNVVLPDGRHHTFAQFGSGTFVHGVCTLLSRFMLIEPYALFNEADHLASLGENDALDRLFIDERSLVITPPQQMANRIRERRRGAAAHGTCGVGVGECVEDALVRPEIAMRAGDLRDPDRVRRKLTAILDDKRAALSEVRDVATADESRLLDDPAWIDVAVRVYGNLSDRVHVISAGESMALLRNAPCSIFEGAQGVLLDEYHGFHPHTTWSTTTFANADALLDEAGADARRHRIGVLRTYLTRHGQGPFVTESELLQPGTLPEPHNANDGWQGSFRRGALDLVMLRYALKACEGVESLAVTHLDRLAALPPRVCEAYDVSGAPWAPAAGMTAAIDETRTQWLRRATPRFRHWPMQDENAFIAHLECALETPVGCRSRGPTCLDKSGAPGMAFP